MTMTVVKKTIVVAALAAAAMVSATTVSRAGNAGVNIIYPPKLTAAAPAEAETAPAKTTVTVNLRPRKIDYHRFWRSYHKFRVNRAIFQLYHTDRRKYGGRRYPF
jgi:Rieske Fe-S protein